jgi:hypothetical protein
VKMLIAYWTSADVDPRVNVCNRLGCIAARLNLTAVNFPRARSLRYDALLFGARIANDPEPSWRMRRPENSFVIVDTISAPERR